MLLRSSLKWLVSGALVVFVAGSATAQPSGGGGAAGDAQVGLKQPATLSLQEQVAQTDASIGRMEQASNVVRRQLGAAREARDVVKTLCLNDKLSQIDVAIRSARDRKASHASAVARNDAELAGHEFTIMMVLRQRSEQLTAEANQCIGEELSFVGKTEVITQIDPTLPGSDVTDPPATDPTLVSAPPVCVSCNGK
jgi:hypothetical protein